MRPYEITMKKSTRVHGSTESNQSCRFMSAYDFFFSAFVDNSMSVGGTNLITWGPTMKRVYMDNNGLSSVEQLIIRIYYTLTRHC